METGSIICPPALFEYCAERYPDRIVHMDIHPPNDRFYVFGKRGMYIVKNKTEIWVTGDVFPTIVRRR